MAPGDARRKSAEKYFKRRYWKDYPPEMAEDFGSFVLEQEHGGRQTLLRNHAKEFDRENFRRLDKKGILRGSSDFMAQKTRAFDTDKALRHIPDRRNDITNRFENAHCLRDKRLQTHERCILILHFEWGFTIKEIADVLGGSDGRISQMLTKVLKDQMERMK